MATSLEEKNSAANYVLNFYDNVQRINHFFAIYSNFLLFTQSQYSQDVKVIKDRLSEQDKVTFTNTTENLHYYIDQSVLSAKVFAKVKGFKTDTPESSYSKVLELHKTISSNYTIKKEELSAFVESINYFLAENIMPSLLQSSQDLINRVTTSPGRG